MSCVTLIGFKPLQWYIDKCRAEEALSTPTTAELGRKLAAELILGDDTLRVIVPSWDEWAGLNLLDRDGEL